MLHTVKGEDFQERISRIEGPILIMFSARWCPHCRYLRPHFVELSGKAGIDFMEVELEHEGDLWDTYSIEAIPTLVLFRSGRPTVRRDSHLGVGLKPSDILDPLREAGLGI